MNMKDFKDRAKRLYQKAGKELKARIQKAGEIKDVREDIKQLETEFVSAVKNIKDVQKDIKRLERKINHVLSILRKRP